MATLHDVAAGLLPGTAKDLAGHPQMPHGLSQTSGSRWSQAISPAIDSHRFRKGQLVRRLDADPLANYEIGHSAVGLNVGTHLHQCVERPREYSMAVVSISLRLDCSHQSIPFGSCARLELPNDLDVLQHDKYSLSPMTYVP